MDQVLLERDDTLGALLGGVEEAAAGRGSVVLLSGGAGLGKTSVLRAFVRTAAARARVLLTSCDDLIAPRTLGRCATPRWTPAGRWRRPSRRAARSTASSPR
jgi:predicted ATPase